MVKEFFRFLKLVVDTIETIDKGFLSKEILKKRSLHITSEKVNEQLCDQLTIEYLRINLENKRFRRLVEKIL